MGYNVAIDGPAGAGKSTIARLVAMEKGYVYVDTGAMYRALALYILEEGIAPEDEAAMIEACQRVDVSIQYEGNVQQVFLNNENVTSRIRTEAVGNMASISSALPQVRDKLLTLQRRLAEKEDVVMDGRDIGTNILPHADVKIYLTASVETRAKRRCHELREKGEASNYEDIEKDIYERDQRDMERDTAPLKKARDAILIDSSHMTKEAVVAEILKHCRQTF